MSHLKDEFQDDEWKTDEDEEADEFPMDDDEDEKAPDFSKKGSGNKTIFVTYQFRFFEDDYQIIGPIGEPGQFGIAYECYLKNDSNQTRRCVKEINKARFHHISAEARNDILQTMQNEIAILRKVEHPNIVKLFDVYEDRHKLHLVMEFLPGGELFGRICEKESFSEKEASHVLEQILKALDHMHDKNILHLDLKPDNILFANKSDESPIKLIDFGMARVVPRLAKLKDRVGTPNYMAPEVFQGNYSKAADVWSVGIILFCMLFGFPPFYVDDNDIHLDEHKQLEMKIKQGFTPQVLEGFGAWFPQEIPVSDNCRYLLGKMLEMDVKKRWTVKECLSSQWVRGFAPEKTIPPIVKDALKKFNDTSKFKVAISNLFQHQVDEDHLAEMRKWFAEVDTDGDGTLSLKEFKHGMQKYKTDLDDKQLEQLFKNIDLDDSRGITFDEIMSITAHRMLVDEDERLYQAFQDLDEDGNGCISKEELEQALSKFDNKHKRTKSKLMLTRFKSAFNVADKNSDGQIDYEEFLRVIHPDFTDDKSMSEFKNNVIDGSRVRGIGFNVDFQNAQAAGFVEPTQTPKASLAAYPKQMSKVLTLDSFKKTKSDNSTNSASNDEKKKMAEQQLEITKLKKENEKLSEKLNKAEQSRDEIRDKYEKQTFEMMEKYQQQNEMTNKLKIEWQQSHQKNIDSYEVKLKEKEQQNHEKDVLIANLNQLLDARNKEINDKKQELQNKTKDIKNLEIMLQHAIDSKMKSLVQSHAEIHKLKMMVSDGSKSLSPPMSSGYNSSSASPKHSSNSLHVNGKKKTRTLSSFYGN